MFSSIDMSIDFVVHKLINNPKLFLFLFTWTVFNYSFYLTLIWMNTLSHILCESNVFYLFVKAIFGENKSWKWVCAFHYDFSNNYVIENRSICIWVVTQIRPILVIGDMFSTNIEPIFRINSKLYTFNNNLNCSKDKIQIN